MMNYNLACRGVGVLLATASLLAPAAASAWTSLTETTADAVDGDAPRNEQGRERPTDIVVTGRSLGAGHMAALPVQLLAGDELAHRRQGGLGETLAGLPGVHLDSFGGGASRPVIRGQTLPRIEILSDGANLYDVSSMSPDHAITTDPLLLDAIEIQRGPAAVRYGGNATNGTINLIDSKVPKVMPDGGITGATEVRYGTGDDEKTLVGRVTAGRGQFAIHAEGARRRAGDYDVPDAYGSDKLRDSFADSTTYALGASWITDKGYIGAAYTRVDNRYGLPGHSHENGVCHLHGFPFPPPGRIDLHCVAHGDAQNPFDNPDSDTAFIDLRSERVDVRGDYTDLLPGFENIRIRGSYTDYKHDEVDGNILYSRYTNEVWDSRLEMTHKPLFGFSGTLGVQYTESKFSGLNFIDLHLPLKGGFGFDGIQQYISKNFGIFFNERRSFANVDVEIAARKDWRTISMPIPGSFYADVPDQVAEFFEEFYGPNWKEVVEEDFIKGFRSSNPDRKHAPFSASIGATWDIGSGYSAALSLAHTERAPNMRELFANGNNLATNSYEVGLVASEDFVQQFLDVYGISSEDVTETSRSIDLTLRKVGGPVEFEVGAFYQDVDDYVYVHLLETETITGVPHNFLIYTAADARFAGIDGQVSYQVAPESRVTVFGDYVDAKLKGDKGNLPRIPPGRLGARLRHAAGPLSAEMEYFHTFAQSKIAAYETRTSGYDILNATLGYKFDLGDAKAVELYVRGTNLTNELALVHTSFVKDQSPMRGRSFAFGMRHAF